MQRPFYFINSSIYVEDGEGNTIGEVQQRWHLWQRNYDLYIDRKQYAATNGGLWAWEFLLKDKKGGEACLAALSVAPHGLPRVLLTCCMWLKWLADYHHAGAYALTASCSSLLCSLHVCTIVCGLWVQTVLCLCIDKLASLVSSLQAAHPHWCLYLLDICMTSAQE